VAAPLLENRNVIPRRLGDRARIMIRAPLRTFAPELDDVYRFNVLFLETGLKVAELGDSAVAASSPNSQALP
jgi:hypothetical protein